MFLVVVCILAVNVIACDDGGTDAATPTTGHTAQPLNEEIAEDANDVLEQAEEAQSTLCSICLLGGVPEDCTGVCK